MRTNGTLSLSHNTGSPQHSFNADGEPIFDEPVWGEEIPCFIQDITEDRQSQYEDGKFTNLSYEVICEQCDMSALRAKLVRRDTPLGEFNIKSIRYTMLDRVILVV